jgi:hypothetical protein
LARPAVGGGLAQGDAPYGVVGLSLYLLDTTVLISHRTLHIADALVAGTARAHGAILITDDVGDFPMRDIRVESLPP